MLVQLQIKNVVLIEELTIDFDPHLSVLTGETGAGKSILLDSLGLCLGMRADSSLVRTGAERAQVTAAFSVPSDHPVISFLDELDLEGEADNLILKRTINKDGRSRAFLCDQPVSVTTLRQAGTLLVEMQGQFGQHSLLDPKNHRNELDNFANLKALKSKTATAWREWKTSINDLQAALKRQVTNRQERERLENDFTFLDALELRNGEEKSLSAQRKLLANSEKFREAVSGSLSLLEDNEGVRNGLSICLRLTEKLTGEAPAAFLDGFEALNQALIHIDEAVSCFNSVHIENEPGLLEELEQRLFTLRQAARRFQVPVEDLCQLKDRLARQLGEFEHQQDNLNQLEETNREKKQTFEKIADKLSYLRREAASNLDKALMHELPPLRLEQALFHTEVATQEESTWNADGKDRVLFLFTANSGEPAGPLHKMVSGGELSRLLLALKMVMAGVIPVPTLIFDEVDSGVGGATAAAIGQRLQRLAQKRQVLVVTHSPQVASSGSQHLKVSKQEIEGKIVTSIRQLEIKPRQEEIARMLAGSTITPEARAAAKQLLEG